MNIKTTCIDYTKASVEEREAFSLVPSKIQELEQSILQTYQLDGCIILSTCNRPNFGFLLPKQCFFPYLQLPFYAMLCKYL